MGKKLKFLVKIWCARTLLLFLKNTKNSLFPPLLTKKEEYPPMAAGRGDAVEDVKMFRCTQSVLI